MNTTDFIRSFPEIREKDDKYFLFLGIISGLDNTEIIEILNLCLDQDIFKRKILLNKIVSSVSSWSKNVNDNLFKKIFSSLGTLNSYFKKESASMMLSGLCPYISAINQKKLLHYFLQSNYKNNRKRAYAYLLDNWSLKYQIVVEKAWQVYNDEEIISLLVARIPRSFLLKNFKDISCHFEEEDLDYDFHLKVIRNKFYARIVEDISSELKQLKDKDPISFIFIMKECGRKIDPGWAMEIYRKFPRSRKYLPRWYAEMKLWKEIIKIDRHLFD